MHLFLDDFRTFLVKSNADVYKAMGRAFAQQDYKEGVRQAVSQVVFHEEWEPENPLVDKLCLYVLAHRNYLASLTLAEIGGEAVNWGLQEKSKLE